MFYLEGFYIFISIQSEGTSFFPDFLSIFRRLIRWIQNITGLVPVEIAGSGARGWPDQTFARTRTHPPPAARPFSHSFIGAYGWGPRVYSQWLLRNYLLPLSTSRPQTGIKSYFINQAVYSCRTQLSIVFYRRIQMSNHFDHDRKRIGEQRNLNEQYRIKRESW